MGIIDLNKIDKAKLFCALMCRKGKDTDSVNDSLISEFGEIESSSIVFDFIHSDYYEREFGENLQKSLIVFKKTVNQETLADIKIITNAIEESHFFKEGKRTFNIDPGFILPSKLILASTKDFSHRIYLGKGIYAEVTLMFTKKGVKYFEWTYPDYKSNEISDFLIKARRSYIHDLKEK